MSICFQRDGIPQQVFDKFRSFVSAGEIDECWPWAGSRLVTGYGRMQFEGKVYLATHIALALDDRPRPAALHALHSCDNPPCVNPKHLRWGTTAENVEDMCRRGRNRPVSGDAHYSRTRPQLMARGDRNGSRLHIEKMPRGDTSPVAKLTSEIVLSIRSAKGTQRDISERFGISESQVWRILHRKNWKHI